VAPGRPAPRATGDVVVLDEFGRTDFDKLHARAKACQWKPGLASVVYGPRLLGVVTDPSWLSGVFVLGPVVGLSSVVTGVIVSSRVNDPRVAQQIGGVIIVPIIGVTLVQATGSILVGASGYLLLAAAILAISLVGLRIGVTLFDREAILTRWR